jgi:hypothetical protein
VEVVSDFMLSVPDQPVPEIMQRMADRKVVKDDGAQDEKSAYVLLSVERKITSFIGKQVSVGHG